MNQYCFFEIYEKLEQAMCFRHAKSVDTKILKWTAFNKFEYEFMYYSNGLDVIDLSWVEGMLFKCVECGLEINLKFSDPSFLDLNTFKCLCYFD